jgi:hypothetical protein
MLLCCGEQLSGNFVDGSISIVHTINTNNLESLQYPRQQALGFIADHNWNDSFFVSFVSQRIAHFPLDIAGLGCVWSQKNNHRIALIKRARYSFGPIISWQQFFFGKPNLKALVAQTMRDFLRQYSIALRMAQKYLHTDFIINPDFIESQAC